MHATMTSFGASAASVFRTVARSRCSTKRFARNRAIPPSTLQDIVETTATSPSGFNLQPTHVILVQCPDVKRRLSEHAMLGAGNAYRTSDASTVAVFVADLEPTKRIPKIVALERDSGAREPGYLATLPVVSSFLLGEGAAATLFKRVATDVMSPLQPMPSVESVSTWSTKNAGIMAQTYVLAAASHGLATCMMEGFDARRVREVLRIPDRYTVPLMVATGYEYEDQDAVSPTKRSPRLDPQDVFFLDTFGASLPLQDEDTVMKSESSEKNNTTKVVDANDSEKIST